MPISNYYLSTTSTTPTTAPSAKPTSPTTMTTPTGPPPNKPPPQNLQAGARPTGWNDPPSSAFVNEQKSASPAPDAVALERRSSTPKAELRGQMKKGFKFPPSPPPGSSSHPPEASPPPKDKEHLAQYNEHGEEIHDEEVGETVEVDLS